MKKNPKPISEEKELTYEDFENLYLNDDDDLYMEDPYDDEDSFPYESAMEP